ncbi:MAG: NAD-dependent epimerase/dehydratase family protein [Salibacteraceae bacterium]|nr:NAD-dependent epimerase/dehydratase family protein [Salibacteraceae bacterium]|tara:strand:- start:20272 stop:21210 length:939 start_codon:yes stop_codon:yes gene_type:complete
MVEKILIIGSLGQVGQELFESLKSSYGASNVIASDVKDGVNIEGRYEKLDILDKSALFDLVKKNGITQVYNLAALLSATAEKHPRFGWDLTIEGQFNVLNLAKEGHIKKIFWPSSIAVFGPTTPKDQTPQQTIIEPNTVYGIGKLAGEMWNKYYFEKYGVDVRGVRFPGLIGWKSLPGGGTTDYAVDIFYSALRGEKFDCFLREDTELPMMHMEDAIRATREIMEASADEVKLRTCYNIAAMNFDPKGLAAEIKARIPDFEISYNPDFRQDIAATWPRSIEDSPARNDWSWKEKYDLKGLVDNMIENLKGKV